LVTHSPKNWSFICQKIGNSFAKILVTHLPKNWLFIRQNFGCSFAKILVVHLPKFWLFIRQNFGLSFAKILVIDLWRPRSFAKILVFHKQMIDIFQFLEHNHAYILPIYNQEPLTKYQLKQLTQYEQNK